MEDHEKDIESNLEEAYTDIKYENFVVNVMPYKTLLTNKYLKRKPYQLRDPKIIKAFIPGLIQKIQVKKGKDVKKGGKLLILEAMKMNNQLFAPVAGKVKKIHVKEGDMVVKDQVLMELE